MEETKYPEIEVQLTGLDGNAFLIIGRVKRALKKAGVTDKEIAKFQEEAMSGDYYNVIVTATKWVTVL